MWWREKEQEGTRRGWDWQVIQSRDFPSFISTIISLPWPRLNIQLVNRHAAIAQKAPSIWRPVIHAAHMHGIQQHRRHPNHPSIQGSKDPSTTCILDYVMYLHTGGQAATALLMLWKDGGSSYHSTHTDSRWWGRVDSIYEEEVGWPILVPGTYFRLVERYTEYFSRGYSDLNYGFSHSTLHGMFQQLHITIEIFIWLGTSSVFVGWRVLCPFHIVSGVCILCISKAYFGS